MVGNRVPIWSLVDKLSEEGGLSGAGIPSQHYFEQFHFIIKPNPQVTTQPIASKFISTPTKKYHNKQSLAISLSNIIKNNLSKQGNNNAPKDNNLLNAPADDAAFNRGKHKNNVHRGNRLHLPLQKPLILLLLPQLHPPGQQLQQLDQMFRLLLLEHTLRPELRHPLPLHPRTLQRLHPQKRYHHRLHTHASLHLLPRRTPAHCFDWFMHQKNES